MLLNTKAFTCSVREQPPKSSFARNPELMHSFSHLPQLCTFVMSSGGDSAIRVGGWGGGGGGAIRVDQANLAMSRGAPEVQCARSAGAVQLFGHLAVLETHTL